MSRTKIDDIQGSIEFLERRGPRYAGGVALLKRDLMALGPENETKAEVKVKVRAKKVNRPLHDY